jgi:hypothetical protein
MSRGSSVGIATGYGLDDRRVEVRAPVGSRMLTSPDRPDWLWGPSNLLCNGYRVAVSARVKWQGREADQLVPRPRKRGSVHPLPHTSSWRSAQLVTRKDNFNFLSLN